MHKLHQIICKVQNTKEKLTLKLAFKVYPRNLALHIAESKLYAKNRLETMLKDGDVNE